MKYMRETELIKMKTMPEITTDLSMKVSMQNMKQSLKSELNDKQLADLLFNKFEFTNTLIEDHLA